MMRVQLKNFGPISEASIRIGKLTIFAGANNTGKSFASRLVYSILNSLESDLYIAYANHLLYSMHPSITLFRVEDHIQKKRNRSNKAVEILNSILGTISQVRSKALTLRPSDITSPDVVTLLQETRSSLNKNIDHLRSGKVTRDIDEFITIVEPYLKQLNYVQQQVAQENIHENFVKTQLKSNVEKELTSNFQIPSVATLFANKSSTPTVKFVGGGNDIGFTLEQHGTEPSVKLTCAHTGQNYPSNIFLESPIYWKLGSGDFSNPILRRFPTFGGLAELGDFPDYRRFSQRLALSGVPGYVSSVQSSMHYDYTGEIAFPEILEWIKGDEVLGGGLVISAAGQLLYNDGRSQYPLQVTATGVTSIGIIGLLIERKLINEQTVLFIDEPESNLHPAWQVLMARLLLKLAQAGVKVVFATHSVDILKFIEVSARNDPDIVDLIQLNHFPQPDDNNADFFDRMRVIQQELSNPFYRLYIGGV